MGKSFRKQKTYLLKIFVGGLLAFGFPVALFAGSTVLINESFENYPVGSNPAQGEPSDGNPLPWVVHQSKGSSVDPFQVVEGESPNGMEPNKKVLQLHYDSIKSGFGFHRLFPDVHTSEKDATLELKCKVRLVRFTDDSDYVLGILGDDPKGITVAPVRLLIRQVGRKCGFEAYSGKEDALDPTDMVKTVFSNLPIYEGEWYGIDIKVDLKTKLWSVVISLLTGSGEESVSAKDLRLIGDTDAFTGVVFHRRSSSAYQLNHQLDDVVVTLEEP